MKIKSKKAQIGELIPDTIGLVFIALLLILFFVLSSTLWGFPKKGIKDISTEQAIHDQEHLSLYAWLQKTVEIEIEGNKKKQEITIADLIRLSKIDPFYKDILNSETEKAFDELYDYRLEIKDKGSLFYIPSNKTIITSLEIKSVK